MRVCKSQCSLFKDYYGDYLKNKVDGETKGWMTKHKEECSFCKEWAKSYEENREDKVALLNAQKDMFDETKGIIKKVKLIISLGIGMVVFVALWMSGWLSA